MNEFDQVRAAARRLFITKDGETVLNYLNARFYDCRIKNDAMARQVGHRDVVQEIHHLMRQTND